MNAEADPTPRTSTKSARRQRLLFEMNPNPIAEFDLEGRFVRVNPVWSRMSGYSQDELRGRLLESTVDESFISIARRIFRDAANGAVSRHELGCRHRNGSRFDIDITFAPLADDEIVSGVYGLAGEITARKRRQNYIRVAASALTHMVEAVIITNPARAIIWANPSFTTMTGYSLQKALGRTLDIIDGGDDSDTDGGTSYSQAVAIARADGHWQGELRCRRNNGDRFASLVSVSAVRDEGDDIINYVDVLTDLSALKNYQSRVDFLVSHDPLTRLPRRSLFEHDLLLAIEQAHADHEALGIAVIGLDGFRMINDSLGHKAGDAVLHEVAARLAANLREVDTVARLSGDQFAVLLPNAADADNIGLVINKLLKKLGEPFVVHGERLFLSASAGICCYPKDGRDAAVLTANADAAMYQAKFHGRNTYRFYDPGINRQVHERLRIANNLRQAAERSEFALHYQPCVNLQTGKLAGVEALLRWQHPKLGEILPDRFIGLAEDMGLISSLGKWVLRTACEQIIEWRHAGYELPRIAVNLSVAQFRQPDLIHSIQSVLEETGVQPSLLELEITESTLMDDPAAYRKIIRKLNKLGVSFAIDDFGTGYSSLAYLRDLPVDCLKIDQSFVAGIPNDKEQMAITRAIINMARTLDKRIIAEGIETEAQLEFLRDQGCDEGQGFFISRPKPPEDIQAALADGGFMPSLRQS
ncbi:MAG TPA: EAL domain-containing protein [Gammaproteobacteria bacterium]|nr:EAL domain-containing protein [Gammaproteobacteria bacterium]